MIKIKKGLKVYCNTLIEMIIRNLTLRWKVSANTNDVSKYDIIKINRSEWFRQNMKIICKMFNYFFFCIIICWWIMATEISGKDTFTSIEIGNDLFKMINSIDEIYVTLYLLLLYVQETFKNIKDANFNIFTPFSVKTLGNVIALGFIIGAMKVIFDGTVWSLAILFFLLSLTNLIRKGIQLAIELFIFKKYKTKVDEIMISSIYIHNSIHLFRRINYFKEKTN